jgi:putative membrane protein insertion efficiency factor
MVILSPVFGGACKFHPSCSNYAYEAIARHGARRGTALAVKRLLRCRPFTKGGFDPVPAEEDYAPQAATSASLVEPHPTLCGMERRQ